MRGSSPAGLLTRQFFRRLLDNDLLSPQSDGGQNLGVILGILASPGIVYTALLLLIYFNPLSGPAQRLIFALPDKLLLIGGPMLLMALVTVVQWDALSLDARDLAIVGPLPLSSGQVIRAKLASLAVFVLLFGVAVTAIPTIMYPPLIFATLQIGFGRVFLLIAVQALVAIAATVFGFLAILAVRELLRTILGFRLFKRVTTLVQFVLALSLVTGLLLAPGLASRTGQWIDTRSSALAVCPPAWFLGLQERLVAPIVLGAPGLDQPRSFEIWSAAVNDRARRQYQSYAPLFDELATLALVAFAIALVAGIGGHLLHARDATRLAPAARRRRSTVRRALVGLVVRIFLRAPASQAGFFFTLQTLGRSAVHRLYLAGHLALAVAFSVLFVASASARGAMTRGAPPSAFLLAVPMVLSFFFIIGLRQAFAIPAELGANWVFQMYAGPQRRPYLAGVRRAVQIVLLPALMAVFIPLSAVIWGVQAAVVHYASGLVASWILLEFALASLESLPFTCSHVPGSANLKTWWPVYGIVFLFSTLGLALVERAALRSTATSLVLLVGLAIAFAGAIAWRRSIERRQSVELVFEEQPEGAQELGLQALW